MIPTGNSLDGNTDRLVWERSPLEVAVRGGWRHSAGSEAARTSPELVAFNTGLSRRRSRVESLRSRFEESLLWRGFRRFGGVCGVLMAAAE
jgi:hypothetical protein